MDVTRHRYAVEGWGVGEIAVRDGVLVEHALPSRRRRLPARAGGPPGGASTPEVTLAANPSQRSDGFVPDLCRRFAAHLAGMQVAYDDVAVDDTGLSAVPARASRRGALARDGARSSPTAGSRRSPVGHARRAPPARFCASNRLSLVVPCHRIVAAGQGEPFELGGYGPGGSGLKRRLLALEGTLL